MPFKLVVVDTSGDPFAAPETFVFHQDRVIIGRDASNDLPLPDERRIVSKQHAELVRQGDRFQIKDLGSKNFTFLNGERLPSNQPFPVQPGDTVRIGEFDLSVEIVDAASEPAPGVPHDYDQTVFDAAFVNPFNEGAQLIGVALRDLANHYAREVPSRRDDALREALGEVVDAAGEEMVGRMARLFGVAPAPAPRPEVPAAVLQPAMPSPPSPAPPPPARPTAEGPTAGTARAHRVLDAALQALARLLGAPWQFRHEFIGQTIMQAQESAFLFEGEAAVLRRHLLEAPSSDEEVEARLRLLEEAAGSLALHQVAMLDGYKAAVREGGRELIDQLNPEQLVEAVRAEKALLRFFPARARSEALSRLQEQLRELRGEDWSAAERRVYRPAFIKAYLARMTARLSDE